MSVPCHVCGVGLAPSEAGKCSDCAAKAVDEWKQRQGKNPSRPEDTERPRP
jgi:NMD protein affecting ribosome stability and mRNA decay